MNGIGKSLRERAAMTFIDNCKEVATDFLHVNNWIEWDAFADAAKELVGVLILALLISLFPVSLPLCAFVRMKAARKRFQDESKRHAKVVARMQSRVQKAEKETA